MKHANTVTKDMFEQARDAFFEISKTSSTPSVSSIDLPKRQSEPPAEKK